MAVVVVLVVVVVRGVHGCVGVGVHACMCGSLYCINEIVTLQNLTLFINTFTPVWLIVIFCLFINALYEWNITKTNS